MTLLELDTRKKEKVEITIELNKGNSKEYEVKVIFDSQIFTKKSDSSYLLGLYYLVLSKSYLEKKNT